jgi:hypothetical protein
LSERVYLVVDGIDGRSITWSSRTRAGSRGVGQDMIVEVAPVVSCPRPADGNIAANAEENDGVYRPSRHLERIRDSFERQGQGFGSLRS